MRTSLKMEETFWTMVVRQSMSRRKRRQGARYHLEVGPGVDVM